MANLPQNTTYGTNASANFNPSSKYKSLSKNLAEFGRLINEGVSPFEAPALDDYQSLKDRETRLRYEGKQVPTGTPLADVAPGDYPIPYGYSGFRDPLAISGTSLEWKTPTDPRIRSLKGGDIPSQFVVDLADQDALIKSERGYDPVLRKAALGGRPSAYYEVDHILPLNLGGDDLEGNMQVLNLAEHRKKTKAQAVPYTLYVNGKIPLNAARNMALFWQNRDLTDIPTPDDNGLIPLEIAQETADRWSQPKKTTIKDVISNIPQTAKEFGRGWLPDPIREFMKGTASGASLGFIPYEPDTDEDSADKYFGYAGQLAGGLAGFVAGNAFLGVALKAAGFTGRAALGAARAKAGTELAKNGFGAAKATSNLPTWVKSPTLGQRLTKPLTEGGRAAAATRGVASAEPVVFNTLKNAPDYLKRTFAPLTKGTVKHAAKLGTAFAAMGEAHRYIAHQFNPYIISGEMEPTKIDNHLAALIGDFAMGVTAGIAAPTLRGAIPGVIAPMGIVYLSDPENPIDALTTGLIFGAMHGISAGAKKSEMKRVKVEFEKVQTKMAKDSLEYYAPGVLPKEGVPLDKPTVTRSLTEAQRKLDERFFFGETSKIVEGEGFVTHPSSMDSQSFST